MTASHPGRAGVAALSALVLAAMACSGGRSSAPPSDPPPSAPPATSAAPTHDPSPSASSPIIDGPPIALASVEGGDAVAGQLGTYTWEATGSDSPWLPGTPIRVGAGETLAVHLEPSVVVETWTARYVPRTQDGPDGAIGLGHGAGPIRLDLPPPGTWTVELTVVFAAGRGVASYAWAVTVR